ncbi:MAG: 4-alpha-glucanotransferase [Clostridia bacterium]|nr:4-alpha-glucanotransferase [Clostridia bacterium]
MHISSLPGKFGIGTLGQEAYAFVDFLKSAGQKYWQVLPIGPTGFGDSPYQSFSSFAGNEYFIDFDLLEKEGYLKKSDYENIKWGTKEESVDYKILYENRFKVFKKLFENFEKKTPEAFHEFIKVNTWVKAYSDFMVKQKRFGENFDGEDRLYQMLQFFFFEQWGKLHSYANDCGIKIIGDIPIYVAQNSADIESEPEQFLLDKNLKPIKVAGCPPDDFSEDGQLWGNPLYDWDYMKKTNYEWWVRRIKHCEKLFDIVRIDHFRAFDSYYSIDSEAENAQKGEWCKGPGIDFFDEVKKHTNIPIIAEDLGFLTLDVKALLKQCGYPGMKVLQFAFDSREENDYLPNNYPKNCVVYTGTHDNNTILGWFDEASETEIKEAIQYMRLTKSEGYNWGMMNTALSSIADTVILTMQDILSKKSDARMNTPSTVGDNWKWRMKKNEITDELAEKLKTQTKIYGR